ncbi:MarR family transcriptional regulator [Rhizobium sp. CCGE 510]|nr:MarR family transcriptional regulator [Rhizobium sp. CCGE 510]
MARPARIDQLEEKGRATVETAVDAHVDNQHRLSKNPSAAEKADLDRLLRKFVADFE